MLSLVVGFALRWRKWTVTPLTHRLQDEKGIAVPLLGIALIFLSGLAAVLSVISLVK
jgi:hypothetical protein